MQDKNLKPFMAKLDPNCRSLKYHAFLNMFKKVYHRSLKPRSQPTFWPLRGTYMVNFRWFWATLGNTWASRT